MAHFLHRAFFARYSTFLGAKKSLLKESTVNNLSTDPDERAPCKYMDMNLKPAYELFIIKAILNSPKIGCP